MSNIKNLIANVKKNLPILKPAENVDNVVLVEGKSYTIVDKLNRHRKNELPEEETNKNESFKWIKMKEKMMLDMEQKRDDEWKMQTLNDKFENEEIDELFKDEEEQDESQENDEIDNGDSNKLFDDAAIQDDESEDSFKIDEEIQSEQEDRSDCHSDNELFSSNMGKSNRIEDDPLSDSELNDEFMSNYNENNYDMDNLFETDEEGFTIPNAFAHNLEKKCISQSLPLTPLFLDNKSDALSFDALNPPEAENLDSQLANICSGGFDNSFVTNNESDDDGQDENADASSSFSESEDKIENSITKSKNNKNKRINQFIEDEAELSGSEGDVSSDEDDEDDEELELEEIQEDLPSDDELKDQVEKIYNKDLLDEDKRQLMILKEMFFEDGDLHDDDGDRKKKFKWQLSDEMADFTNILSDSDEENSSSSEDEIDLNKVIRLKKEVTVDESKETIEEIISDKGDVSIEKTSIIKTQVKQVARTTKVVKKQNTKISSFFIKDERLKDILNKRPATLNDNTNNKKLKTQESTSIFDVIQW